MSTTDDFNWTNDNLEKLFQLVKDRPLLWNTEVIKTSNRSTALRLERQQLWYEIGEILGVPPDYAEKKIQVLKSQFNRETRRIRLAMKENKPVGHVWFGYSRLMFMIYNADDYDDITDYIKDLNTTEIIKLENESGISSKEKQNNFENKKIHELEGEELLENELFETNYDSEIACDHQASPKRKKKRKSKKQFNTKCKMFGLHVAKELYNIKDEKMQIIAQNKIKSVLCNAKLGLYKDNIDVTVDPDL